MCQHAPDTDRSKIGEGGGGDRMRAVTDSSRSQRQDLARRGAALPSEPSPQPHLLLRRRNKEGAGFKESAAGGEKRRRRGRVRSPSGPRKRFKNNKMRDNVLVLNIKTPSLRFKKTPTPTVRRWIFSDTIFQRFVSLLICYLSEILSPCFLILLHIFPRG